MGEATAGVMYDRENKRVSPVWLAALTPPAQIGFARQQARRFADSRFPALPF